MWHDQFFPPQAADRWDIPTVLRKPASGGKPGNTGGHSVRVAIVFGLADLFFDFGQDHAAAELYHLFTQLKVFAHKRTGTISKSWMQRGDLQWQSDDWQW